MYTRERQTSERPRHSRALWTRVRFALGREDFRYSPAKFLSRSPPEHSVEVFKCRSARTVSSIFVTVTFTRNRRPPVPSVNERIFDFCTTRVHLVTRRRPVVSASFRRTPHPWFGLREVEKRVTEENIPYGIRKLRDPTTLSGRPSSTRGVYLAVLINYRTPCIAILFGKTIITIASGNNIDKHVK